MLNNQNSKQYNLELRTFEFAKKVRDFVRKLQKTLINMDDIKQLLRSSASVGANYIEANESLSKKDFRMRIMICRKEAKETEYWLKLLVVNEDEQTEKNRLTQESIELRKIFGAILEKTKTSV